jgi:hypothetical protein
MEENKSKKQELQEQLLRDRKQNEERIELLKMKSGTATEAEIENLLPAEAAPAVPRTFKQKWENFWYQYKAHVIFAALIAVFAFFIVTSILSNVKPDITVGIISADRNFYALTEDVAYALRPYCRDYNGDGQVSVNVLRFLGTNASGVNNSEINQAEVARLYEEFRSNSMILIITDEDKMAELDLAAGTFADGKTLFPGDKNAVLNGYLLDNTRFKDAIGYPEMPGGYFAAFRIPQEGYGDLTVFETNYNNALEVWRNFISDTPVEQK